MAPDFEPCLAVGLYTEWREVLTRPENRPPDRTADDDMVLELAFAAGCRHIVTHHVRDLAGSERLGVSAVSPREFLNRIKAKA